MGLILIKTNLICQLLSKFILKTVKARITIEYCEPNGRSCSCIATCDVVYLLWKQSPVTSLPLCGSCDVFNL